MKIRENKKNKGIQFYHFEGYSRIESKSKAKKGNSIYSIAGEAERTQGYCDHVEEPKEPVLLYGVSFSEVLKVSENYAENTFDSMGRAVRINGLCAIFGVVSAPPDMSEKVWAEYKKLIIEFLKETWGSNLKSIIEHIDEYFEPDPENGIMKRIRHRHLHFAVVPPVGVNLAEIHPGIKAKRAADYAYGVTKKPDGLDDKGFEIFKKEGRQAGDRAYRKAMSIVQDDFFNKVSDKYGLSRYGPNRTRLTRDEIKKRDHEKRLKQKLAVEIAEQKEKAKELAKENEKAQLALEKTLSEKHKQEDELRKREKVVSDREKDLKEKEITIDSGKRQIADYQKGLKTSLRGWQLPNPNILESAEHYLKRFGGEIMGIVQRAMNIITDYNKKIDELKIERVAFEAEKEKRKKEETVSIAKLERNHNQEVQRRIVIFQNLKERVLGVKTPQELTALQSELSYSHSHSGW